ncbi:MAG: AraC family transcriptional regulator [Defluviitaleaceae bacterium]|nr:AraC family transcriptional regulator [Defluviitaleaceae bacterium]
MEWLARMNATLDYIESNLCGEIDYGVLEKVACCSAHTFFKMFSYVADVSLSEYVRRRRLTLAALELQSGDVNVIDVAGKYGYESPVSFARAFQVLHGVTPTQAKKSGINLKAYPRISFQVSISGKEQMDYRIEKKDAFQVFGIEGIFKTDERGEPPRTPADLWADCHANGTVAKLDLDAGKLPGFVGKNLDSVHGICSYKEVSTGEFPYMICAFMGEDSQPHGYTVLDVPAHTWAIFPSGKFGWDNFDTVIESLYKRFFGEWLPTSQFEQVGGLDLEIYGGDEEFGYFELWFAVKKLDIFGNRAKQAELQAYFP